MVSEETYIKWIATKVDQHHSWETFSKLLTKMHHIDYTYYIPTDANRGADGMTVRANWLMANGISANEEMKIFQGRPCSVLEMIFALANRIETHIMQNESMGDRTSKWFWMMIRNIGVGRQTNDCFDEKFVENRVSILLERSYLPNGKGGLFYLPNHGDIREVEIWYQAMWYLDDIMEDNINDRL